MIRTMIRCAAVLCFGIASAGPVLGGDGELLKPVAIGSVTSQPVGITYKLSDGSENWNPDPKARIVSAMNQAVAIYNKYGEFNRVLTANWNPGTPTADASFGGWINFGGQIGTRTALHEIAHCLGIGTCPKWGEFARDGKWTGKYGIAQLHQLDGPDAVLHCDHQHFWPYGLNYESEGGPENFRRNVLMVTAMRADMGLGPPPHPAATAYKLAKENDVLARANLDAARSRLNVLKNQIEQSLGTRAEVALAMKQAIDAKASYDAAMVAAQKNVDDAPAGMALVARINQSQKDLDALQADSNASPQDLTNAAQNLLSAKAELSSLRNKALSSDSQVRAARAKYFIAASALDSVRQTAMANDPSLIQARQNLATASTQATTADQAMETAAKAAATESAALATP